MVCRPESLMPARTCAPPVQAGVRRLEVKSASAPPAKEAGKSDRHEARYDSPRLVLNAAVPDNSARRARKAVARVASARPRTWKLRSPLAYRPGHAFGLPAREMSEFWEVRPGIYI